MQQSVRNAVKRFARLILGEYSLYFVYRSPSAPLPLEAAEFLVREVGSSELEGMSEEWLQDQLWYGGSQSTCYGCFEAGSLTGVCFYWYGERYAARGFWPLAEDEAKLVQILVSPEMRGRGIARALITESANGMRRKGFHRMFARIWHSNHPSRRAFDGAGWVRIALVVEVRQRRLRPLRLKISL